MQHSDMTADVNESTWLSWHFVHARALLTANAATSAVHYSNSKGKVTVPAVKFICSKLSCIFINKTIAG